MVSSAGTSGVFNAIADEMAYRPRPPLVGLPILWSAWDPAECLCYAWHVAARTWLEVSDGPMPSLSEARADRKAALALVRSYGRAQAFADGDGRQFTIHVGDAILGRHDPLAMMLRADRARPPGQQKGPPLAALIGMHAALAAEGISTPDPLEFLSAQDSNAPIEFLRVDQMTAPPPETAWFIPGIVPAREVTIIASDGGVGKSTLVLQWAIEAAAGRGSLGRAPFDLWGTQAVFLGLEDSRETILRRSWEISQALGIDGSELETFRALSRSDFDPSLVRATTESAVGATEFFRRLVAKWTISYARWNRGRSRGVQRPAPAVFWLSIPLRSRSTEARMTVARSLGSSACSRASPLGSI